ncbi:MAG TPA: hypothetical protein VFS40_05715 [Gemmatimonadales bacterium]|nr:hypothetical protein [Gemmatimonadales bacterium]
MRIQQGLRPDQFTLVEHESVIGRVDGAVVTFVGFRTQDAAVQAADVAYAALRRHGTVLAGAPGSPGAAAGSTRPNLSWLGDGETLALRVDGAVVAEVLPPSGWATDGPGWRVELHVAPGAAPELFVLSRARSMWRAIQGYGLVRRMCQFVERPEPPASPEPPARPERRGDWRPERGDERLDERFDDRLPVTAG